MKKALIVTSHVENLHMLRLSQQDYDAVICADGGFLLAKKLNLTPDLLIGDYDSMVQPDAEVIKLPMEKDMTDSEAAIDLAVSQGFSHITIVGGLGGRFDHTMGNIGMLAKYCGKLSHLSLVDGQNYVFMVPPGVYTIPRNHYTYMGIISYGACAENVTLKGVKYPLTNHLLTNATTLGVSNEITTSQAEISFTAGKLLIILSQDIDK